MALMDIFVLASWREGLPRSAIEAAAMARPLVLTDIRGCREVARDGVEGLLVPARDADALTAAIKRLVTDETFRNRLGAAARARAESIFDANRVGDIVVETYRRLIGESVRRPTVAAGSTPDIRLRKLRVTDRAAVARLHRESLPDAFLPMLGDGFLRNLYRALANDEDAICTVAENGSGIVGFVAGTRSVGRTYRRFALRHGPAAVLSAAGKLVRPAVARRAIETARYPASSQALPAAELLSIAVLPDWRGRGVGEMLTTDLLHRLRDHGVCELKVVVAGDNHGAHRFYERLGFRQVARTEVHDGTSSDVMVATCPS